MKSSRLSHLVQAANARYSDPARNRVIGTTPRARVRFELYHAGISLCSYKVRAVLHERAAAYVSHDLSILPPLSENYYPEYVLLRLEGKKEAGRFVQGFTGRSSTGTEGFDPCVVPTLVDHDEQRVIVDSRRICLYLDSTCQGRSLLPEDIRSDVLTQIDLVDRMPHAAVLYGAHPGADPRPASMRAQMAGVYDRKIAALQASVAQAGADPALLSAYKHKILKETAAKEFIAEPQNVVAALRTFEALVGGLAESLRRTGGEWLFGDRFTLADIFWAASLFRIRWLGLSRILDQGCQPPLAAAYCDRLMKRPSFRHAVVDWPAHPPSEHLPDLYPDSPKA